MQCFFDFQQFSICKIADNLNAAGILLFMMFSKAVQVVNIAADIIRK
jgi:hypothetical protein